MLDYREYVYAVYQERSFSRAAQRLHVSQPWLSAAVKKVEEALRLPLFDRSTSPISLTEAGRYYIEQIERVLAIEREMEDRFARMAEGLDVTLRIGSSMFFCTYVLPRLLEDFRAQHPNARLRLLEGTSQSLAERLLRGELDLLVEVERPKHKQIRTLPWAEEEIVLAAPASFEINRELAEYRYSFEELLSGEKEGKPPVPLGVFRDQPFLLLNEEHDSHQRCLDICANAGFAPRVSLSVSQMMTAYYLVCEGRGVAFLRSMIPRFVAPTASVVFYRLDDPLASRTIYLSCLGSHSTQEDSSPMRQSLIDFMTERGIRGPEA